MYYNVKQYHAMAGFVLWKNEGGIAAVCQALIMSKVDLVKFSSKRNLIIVQYSYPYLV